MESGKCFGPEAEDLNHQSSEFSSLTVQGPAHFGPAEKEGSKGFIDNQELVYAHRKRMVTKGERRGG